MNNKELEFLDILDKDIKEKNNIIPLPQSLFDRIKTLIKKGEENSKD